MSNPQRSFEQVKSILGKLDRDIDAARERRLQSRPAPMTVNAPAGFVPPAPSQAPAPQPQAQPAPNDPGRHGYGRGSACGRRPRAFPPSQPRP